MTSRPLLLAALATVCASVVVGAQANIVTLRFRDSKVFATPRAVTMKNAVIRRFEYSQQRPMNAYTRIELWLTNTDIDVCGAPDFRNLASISLQSEDDMILVLQIIGTGFLDNPSPEQKSKAAPFYAAFFTNQWPGDGNPMQFGLTAATRPGRGNFLLINRSKEDSHGTGVSGDLKSFWMLRHVTANKGVFEDWSFDGGAIVTSANGVPSFNISTKSKPLEVDGTIRVTQVCEGIGIDKKFWQDK